MTTLFIIVAFLLGGLLGYTIFYFQYANRHIVNEMRANLKLYKKEIESMSADAQEHMQQNILLKQKVTELYEKNDDLSKVVSDLSRYYYHMKVGSEKINELAKIMQTPDGDIEEKVSRLVGWVQVVTTAQPEKNIPAGKKFF